MNVSRNFVCGFYNLCSDGEYSNATLKDMINIASSISDDGKTLIPLPDKILFNVYGASQYYGALDAQNNPIKCGYMGITLTLIGTMHCL